MLPEDIDGSDGATEEVTAPEDTGYQEILAGEGDAPESATPGEGQEEKTNLDEEKQTDDQKTPESEFNPDEEVTLEIGGKTFTMKQGDVLGFLESGQKLSEREKQLSEKEKSLNADYTKKSQANAEFKKSVESTFGRFPDQAEMQALGTLWKAYFDSPDVKQTIDAILSGGQVATGGGKGSEAGSETPEVTMLKREINSLKSQLGEFISSTKEEKQTKAQAESDRLWNTWVAKKAESNVKITDEVDAAMAPFVAALKQAHPNKDAHWILDEAYRHANIDNLEKTASSKVLESADKVRKRGSIKITPKFSQKPESEMSYAEIMQEAG